VVYAGGQRHDLGREYGLFDNSRLQAHLLARGGMVWRQGKAARIEHTAAASTVTTTDGAQWSARIIVDASGHKAALVQRPAQAAVAQQVAYGIVGAFSVPPVEANQLVLMDYRTDHLRPEELAAPPTFLYAMDLGQGRYFAEETSLASYPAVSFDFLRDRLQRRLAHHGIQVAAVEHEEHCLFPMNLPLPYTDQPLLAYGGAASMVHPASGYQVGAALRRAAPLAAALAAALDDPAASPAQVARTGWQTLWPRAVVRKHQLYSFGLQSLLRCDAPTLSAFFGAFFQLPRLHWAGYLSNQLSTPAVLATMWQLFSHAPNNVRRLLMSSARGQERLIWNVVTGSGK
jgi:lycopene beta-cyclase